MSSTNKTSNYELSQFLGTDKPAWLSDYNSDMSKIDTQMKANADAATAAAGSATSANTAIGTLSNLTTSDKTSVVAAVNEVKSSADTAQNTANSANSTATSALTSATNALNEIAKFNLTSFKAYALNEITPTNASVTGTPSLTLAKDSSNSIFKLYGTVNITSITASTVTLTIGNTGITPDANFNIICAGLYTQNNSYFVSSPRLEIKTNGTIDIVFAAVTGQSGTLRLTPCLYFAKDFGDQPEA